MALVCPYCASKKITEGKALVTSKYVNTKGIPHILQVGTSATTQLKVDVCQRCKTVVRMYES